MHPLQKTISDMFKQDVPGKMKRPAKPPGSDDYAPVDKKHVDEMKAAMAEAPSLGQMAHVGEHFRQKGYNPFDIAHARLKTPAPAKGKSGMAPVLINAQMPKGWADKQRDMETELQKRSEATPAGQSSK